jgi:hypothetical protein
MLTQLNRVRLNLCINETSLARNLNLTPQADTPFLQSKSLDSLMCSWTKIISKGHTVGGERSTPNRKAMLDS